MIVFLFIFCCINFGALAFVTSRFLLRIEKLESIIFDMSAENSIDIILESEDI